jgi:hypothetical protein
MSDLAKPSLETLDASKSQHPGSYRFLIVCALFMLVGIVFLAWLGSPPDRAVAGKAFPVQGLEPLANADAGLPEDSLLGQKTLVLLWSPEHEAVSEHLAEFKNLVQRHPGFAVITIAYSKGNLIVELLQAQAREALERSDVNWPTYADRGGKSTMEYALLMPYGSFGFPTVFVLDQFGKVMTVNEGQSQDYWLQLDQFLSTLK